MKKYLVYDVGGSSVKYAVMNKNKIYSKNKRTTPKDSLDDFLIAVDDVYQTYKEEIEGVAFSMPGIINSHTGFAVHGGALLYIRNLNLKEVIEEKLGTTITIENDGKSAALGEVWKGKLHNVKNGVALILGTGVGGGIILNGQLIKGHHFGAGEFSFIGTNGKEPLADDDSFSAQASTVKLVRDTARALGEEVSEFTGQDLFDELKKGNQTVQLKFTEYCNKLANQIRNLQTILDPEYFVIGGGMSEEPLFVEGIEKAVNDLFDKDPMTEVNGFRAQVLKSELGNDANLYGALYHYLMTEEERSLSENFQ